MAKRTMYSLYHQVAGYNQFGYLAPTMALEVAPGDTFSGQVGLLIRLSPLKHALLQDIWIDQFAVFVPHRLVMADWEGFISEGPYENPTYQVPSHTVQAAGTDSNHALWYNEDPTGVNPIVYSALRWYGYHLIWNEMFRDEYQSVKQPTSSPDSRFFGNIVNHKRDYWNELQDVITRPAGFSAPVVGDEVSATEILRAIAQEKIAMKRATYGTRYIDILKSYGVRVNHTMLQKPEIVGMARGSINVTDVVATSDDIAGGGSSLGQLAGHGIHGGRLRIRRKSFSEHGTLFGFVVVRPNYTDEDFREWFDRPRTYDSFYDPGLVPLPAVEVTAADVLASPSEAAEGFQPWGTWYRKAMSRSMKGLSDWVGHVGGNGVVPGELKKILPGNYSSLFSNTDFGHFQFSAVNKMRAARLIPKSTIAKITGMGG